MDGGRRARSGAARRGRLHETIELAPHDRHLGRAPRGWVDAGSHAGPFSPPSPQMAWPRVSLFPADRSGRTSETRQMMNRQQIEMMWDHLRQVNGIGLRCIDLIPAEKLDSHPIPSLRTPKALAVHLYALVVMACVVA